jgi:orotidine 5'-phosphate decarboxylase subfamily 2
MSVGGDVRAADHPAPAATQVDGYLSKLGARSAKVRSVVCLGLDPDPAALPPGFAPDLGGVARFARLVLDAAAPYVAAVKPNLAFYEAFGSAGMAALEALRAAVPDDLPVVIDAKRGDIGTTAARQAVAIAKGLRADAVTLSPYLGRDAMAPFLDKDGIFVYALCRTSNPNAAEIQGLTVEADPERNWPAEPLYLRVARTVTTWAPASRIGFVVGATAPAELATIRTVIPDRAFLVPGVGAQGGDLEASLRDGRTRTGGLAGVPGGGLLLNVSRGIAGAATAPVDQGKPADLEARIAQAAADWAARMPVLM